MAEKVNVAPATTLAGVVLVGRGVDVLFTVILTLSAVSPLQLPFLQTAEYDVLSNGETVILLPVCPLDQSSCSEQFWAESVAVCPKQMFAEPLKIGFDKLSILTK